jgi:peptidoglycan hydrolase CwlO-like protein
MTSLPYCRELLVGAQEHAIEGVSNMLDLKDAEIKTLLEEVEDLKKYIQLKNKMNERLSRNIAELEEYVSELEENARKD